MIDTDLSETAIAGLHLPVALALFGLGVGHILWRGLSAFTVLQAAFPIALGGFVVLIVGTSRMLLAGTVRIDVAGQSLGWLPGLLSAVGSLGLYVGFAFRAHWLTPSAIVWGLGLGSHVLLVGYSLARAREGVPVEQAPAAVTVIGALGYGLAAALAVPLVALASFGVFAALHLVLAGFVVLTIAAVAIEVLPRFTGRGLPQAWNGAMAITLALGPMLLAEGLMASGPRLQAGAVVEGVGLIMLGAGLLWMVLGSERERVSFDLYALAGVSVLVGTGVGASMALGWLSYAHAPWHGAVNLLGFVGMVVLGAAIDLFAPAMSSGADSLDRHNKVLLGLGIVAVAGILLAPVLPSDLVTGALAVYLAAIAWHFAGSIGRLR